MTGLELALLLAWGTVVALDLVTFPQALINRPMVAGLGTGLILGAPAEGLAAGVLFELFALDVLPVGASRYPDFGPATVATAAWTATGSWTATLGPAGLLGLAVAWIGGLGMVWVRRANDRRVARVDRALTAGDVGILHRVQAAGLVTDAVRGFAVTAIGLLGASVGAVWLVPGPALARALLLVMVAGGMVSALGGTVRRTAPARLRPWLLAGLAAGALGVWFG